MTHQSPTIIHHRPNHVTVVFGSKPVHTYLPCFPGFAAAFVLVRVCPAAMAVKRPAPMKRPAARKRPAKFYPEVSLELDEQHEWALAYSLVSDQSDLDARAELDAREELDARRHPAPALSASASSASDVPAGLKAREELTARRRPAWGLDRLALSPTEPSEMTAAEPENDGGDGEKAVHSTSRPS